MVDNLKPEDRRKTMQAVKGKGTKLERSLFSMIAGMGLKGWKKNVSSVVGKPDVIFADQKIAIFVDGCFWHGCIVCQRKLPETNREYWVRKINRNVQLAKTHNQQLFNDGWSVIRIWEHEMTSKTGKEEIKMRIRQAIKKETMSIDVIRQDSHQILDQWIDSCTRGGRVSRNTVAIGIVVLDHLRKSCPVSRDDVISQGGEVKGARSGLGNILGTYGIPGLYLKEVTTRQGHQDGQRLFKQFEWGKKLITLTEIQREQVLQELIYILLSYATEWLNRQNLKMDIDRRQAPSSWIHMIVENAKQRSGGVVEQHLIGAKLERRFKGIDIPNHPAHAGDSQTARAGDFEISQLVYHVTVTPSRNIIQKCAENIKVGLHPILLVPSEQENKARILAQDEGIDKELSIISIETFVALNIIELATVENNDFFGVLKEIVTIYNRRLVEVETDLSLQIQVR
jgi:DNA mismatch endonuclease (patch repair protein)